MPSVDGDVGKLEFDFSDQNLSDLIAGAVDSIETPDVNIVDEKFRFDESSLEDFLDEVGGLIADPTSTAVINEKTKNVDTGAGSAEKKLQIRGIESSNKPADCVDTTTQTDEYTQKVASTQTEQLNTESKSIQCIDFVYVPQQDVEALQRHFAEELAALRKACADAQAEIQSEKARAVVYKASAASDLKSVLDSRDELVTRCTGLAEERRNLEAELTRVRALCNDRDLLFARSQEILATNEKLKTQCDELRNTQTDLKRRLREGGALNNTLLAEREKLKAKISALELKVATLEKDKKALKSELQIGNREMQRVATEIVRLEALNKELETKNISSEAMEAISKDKVAVLQAEVERLQRLVVDAQKENLTALAELANLKKERETQLHLQHVASKREKEEGSTESETKNQRAQSDNIVVVPCINIARIEKKSSVTLNDEARVKINDGDNISISNNNESNDGKDADTSKSGPSAAGDRNPSTTSVYCEVRNAFTQTIPIAKKNKGVGVDFYKSLAIALNQKSEYSLAWDGQSTFDVSLDEITPSQRKILNDAFPQPSLNRSIGNADGSYATAVLYDENVNSKTVVSSSSLVECVSCLALRGEISNKNEVIKDLEESLKEARDESTELESSLQTYKRRLSECLTAMETAQEALKKIKSEKEQLVADSKQASALALQKTSEALEHSRQAEILKDTIRELQSKLREVMDQYKLIEAEYNDTVKENQELAQKLKVLNAKFEKIKGEFT